MKAINFTDKEIEFLRNMYQEELADAQKYIDQIKEVLKKLGAPIRAAIEELVEKEPKKKGKRRGRKPKAKVVEPKEPKKRGRKPKVKAVEVKVPKKRGRPKAVPTAKTAPVVVAKPIKKVAKKK